MQTHFLNCTDTFDTFMHLKTKNETSEHGINPTYRLSSDSSSMKPDSQIGQV